MIPVLMTKDGKKIIGELSDTISATVTEQRNGEFTASFSYPYVGQYFSQIDYDSIIQLKPNQKSELQQFRVSSISSAINGIVSYGCEHISYELNKNPVMTVSYSQGTARDVLIEVLYNTMVINDYSPQSDITIVKKCELDFMSARDAILKIQQYFGGELEWDNKLVKLNKNRGVDSGAVISYGNNLLDYAKKLDVSNVYTAISPYVQIDDKSGNKVTYFLPERYLTYSNAENFSYVRAKAVDFTSEFTEEEFESISADPESIIAYLRTKALDYMFYNDPSPATDSVTLSYVDLRKSKEFATIETMNDLGLCDTVTLQDTRLGINHKAKVILTKFNVLTEMYDSLEIGNPQDNLLEALASIINIDNGSNKTIGNTVENIEKNLDEYFSEITVTNNKIVFKSGNIKDRAGVYNTYTYKIERDSDIQTSGVGKIIRIIDPKNRKTKIIRE